MSTLRALLMGGQQVEYHSDPIGEGGMKLVYFTRDKSSVVCFFKDKTTGRDPQRLSRLQAILGKFNPTTDPTTGDYWKKLFCWPTGIVEQPELGVIAPTYPSDYFFASGPWKGKEKEGKWFTSPKLRKMLPESERGNWLNYLRIAICIARAVRALHVKGLAHSDLSNRNCLVDPTQGLATVIDIDSLVVPGVYPPDVLGTPGYIAPEVIATQHLDLQDKSRVLPSIRTDTYALPVLIYEYLLQRHPLKGPKVNSTTSAEEDERLSMGPKALFIEHPNDQSNRPKGITVPYTVLGPYLSSLIEQAFVHGLHEPADRPSAPEWEKALVRTTDLLLPCGNSACEAKWFVFSGSQPVCPYCSWQFRGELPVLNFYIERRAGQFVSDNHRLVVWDYQYIHQWHIRSDCFPGESCDRDGRILCYHQGQWLLVNQTMPSLYVGEQLVPPGQAVALKDGQQIRLLKGDKGKLALVQVLRV